MNYQTFPPHPELSALVKFYWTLEVPYDPKNEKQKIIPDGCVEMTLNLGDKIKRYVSEDDYVIHPDAMVMGQRTTSFLIEPTGNVDSFAVCFYPHGFANFVTTPLEDLVDVEAPISAVLGETIAEELERQIAQAGDTQERIALMDSFLLRLLNQRQTIETLVTTTVDALLETNGSTPIHQILKGDLSKRRQLERKFRKQIGLSPKQLGKVLRLQAALKMMLSEDQPLTNIAYEGQYFDQAHFIKDFKEFVGTTPGEFLGNDQMALATLFYQ